MTSDLFLSKVKGQMRGWGWGSHRLALCQGPIKVMQSYKDTIKRVLIGWHCDKVQGHAELEIEKPRVKTLG